MSHDESDDPLLPRKALRTVTPLSTGHRSTGMDVIGWSILVGLLIVALPLLPVLVVIGIDGAVRSRGRSGYRPRNANGSPLSFSRACS